MENSRNSKKMGKLGIKINIQSLNKSKKLKIFKVITRKFRKIWNI